jgi:hypothetical protein
LDKLDLNSKGAKTLHAIDKYAPDDKSDYVLQAERIPRHNPHRSKIYTNRKYRYRHCNTENRPRLLLLPLAVMKKLFL